MGTPRPCRLLNRDHTNIATGGVPDRTYDASGSPQRPGDRDVKVSPRRDRGTDTPIAPERKTILVVEDDVDAVTILRFALEGDGFVVDSAGDGLSALQKARQTTPDLVILDLNMPRMGGEDFLYAWRAGVESPGVPVIVITAASQALRPEDLGVEAVFPKPFDIDQLLWHVRDLLAISPQARAAAGREPRDVEMAGVIDDLATVMSTLLISAEQLAAAQDLPDVLRPIAATGLDAAQRGSVLARRLNHLINALE
jgi:CheY-like chemotaxis protein